MKRIELLLILLLPTIGFSQNVIYQKVMDAQSSRADAKNFNFMFQTEHDLTTKNISSDVLKEGLLFELDVRNIAELKAANDNRILVNVEMPGNKASVQLDLVKNKLLTDDFILSTSEREELKYGAGSYYHGIISGDENSLVAMTFFQDEIIGFINNDDGNYVIGKLKGEKSKHIIYNDRDIVNPEAWECVTPDDDQFDYAPEMLEWNGSSRDVGDCINVYIEIDDDIVTQKGGAVPATNYITGLFNQCITLYANESLAMAISEIKAWTTNSPYSSNSSSGMLDDFQNNTGAFNGDLAHLVSYQASGGIAAGFSGICNSNPDNSKCFSSIDASYNDVPAYSYSVMVTTHEMGHLIGSRHTHACMWNGNNTAIDGCSGSTEGSCSLPGDPPNGGTIMSYCHISNVGINFNEGFGPQPGNVIRNTVANANCLSPCGNPGPNCFDGIQNGQETGVDCGGPDCPACPVPCVDNEVTLTLVFDNYPEETSWTITNSGGATVASGGTYGSQADGSTLIITECLVDGCYDFTINDTYGDGICCSYGSGSYSLTDASGNVLASGGAFGSSETTNFCLGNSGPTCTDGVQNGQETGVDCGGPVCPACPTCTDGVQNGSETGVDCGGPDCPDCPTCTDGVQNGSETGVDCGGPDCPPCSSGCTSNEVVITLVFDNYPEETSWTITNSSGTTVASGGTYGSQPDGSTLIIEECLPNGCYNFTIDDTYGDGICCSYGNGSYVLVDNSNGDIMASGGSFGSSETTNFCVGGGTGPTCTDGIQNGSETGVDCGGPDCPACPGGTTTLFGSYFETGLDGWTDAGSDCFRYNGSRSYEGNRSMRIRDNSNSSNFTRYNVDLTGYSSVEVTFYFYAWSMENGEDFWLRVNDGSGWQTVATWARGTSFNNNTFYSTSVTLNAADYNFNSGFDFRFQCDASNNSDHIYIDQIIAEATSGGSFVEESGINYTTAIGPVNPEINYDSTVPSVVDKEVLVYPNPATDRVMIKAYEEIQEIQVVSLSGQIVKQIKSESLNEEVLLSDLQPGIYYILVNVNGNITPHKLVKM